MNFKKEPHAYALRDAALEFLNVEPIRGAPSRTNQKRDTDHKPTKYKQAAHNKPNPQISLF